MDNESGNQALQEMLFVHLIAMFQGAAMQQMGKLPNPVTQKIERDLEQSKMSIDMLDMLKEKTAGNLSSTEQDILDKMLFELHMNFVEESGKPDEPESTEEEAGEEADEEKEEEKDGTTTSE